MTRQRHSGNRGNGAFVSDRISARMLELPRLKVTSMVTQVAEAAVEVVSRASVGSS